MGDRTSSFQISFDGSAGNLDDVLAGIRRSVKTAVSDIQATASKVELFDNLGDNVSKAQAAFAAATKTAAELGAQIDLIRATGGKVGADLTTQFRQAEAAATTASKAYATQVTQLTALQTKLSAVGVNTADLAAEQVRLATALKTATAAAAEQSAKSLLGFKSVGDVQPQITALTKAFDTLRLSGTLSAKEIATAQALLADKIAGVRSQVSNLSDRFADQGASIGSVFSTISAKLLGFVASVTAAGAAIGSIVNTSRAFSQGLVQIGTIADLTEEQLTQLGESAKEVATRIGVDLVQAVEQLKDLIRSGLDPDSALLALSAAAETAKASQQDLGDVVKVGAQLLHGYGIQIGDLQKAFDVLFQGMKDGGPTFKELADSLGPLLSVAKLANIPLAELAATLQVMVKSGVPAQQAIADLTKIITKLDSKQAVASLAALGIKADGLVGTFTQLADKGLDLNKTLELGLANPKSIAGLAALTSGANGLAGEMDRLASSSGAAAAAQEKIAATPKDKIDRLSASFDVLKTNVGQSAAQAGGFYDVITRLLNGFNALHKEQIDQDAAVTKFGNSVGLAGLNASIAFDRITSSAVSSAQGVKTALGSITDSVTGLIAGIDAKVAKSGLDLQNLVTDLQANIAASQQATAAAITDLKSRADAQIAALDKSTEAEKATADATLIIRNKLAADLLAVITQNGQAQIKAANDVAAAVQAIAKANGPQTEAQERQTAQNILAIRLAPLQAYAQQLAAALADGVAQEAAYVAKINGINASQVQFNQGVEDKLRDIRNQGLSGFDAYNAKIAEIKQLLADAQTEFAKGGQTALQTGKDLTDKAIALAVGLKTVVNENGTELVTATQLQQTQFDIIKGAQQKANEAFKTERQAAVDGANGAVEAQKPLQKTLTDITGQVNDLKAKLADGLAIKIAVDQASIKQASDDIDANLTEKTHLIPIQADLSKLQSSVDGVIEKLKTGVTNGVNDQLSAIETKLQTIAAKNPELKLDIAPATEQIETVKAAVAKIAELKSVLTLSSNVADVQAAIDKLKLPTESTHTVHIKVDGTLPGSTSATPTVPGFAKGGAVGPRWMTAPMRQAVQRFAEGGGVWRVPGAGNGDTVPARLIPGSFVMRKAATNLYGAAALDKLASRALLPRFAAGGPFNFQIIGSDRPPPDKNYINTSDEEALTGEIDAPTLPSDPKQKRRLIEDYSFAVAAAALTDDYFYWRQNLRLLNSAKDSDDFQPTDAHLEKLLDTARNIGLNLGISHNTHTGFDVDGRSWHKKLATDLPAGLFGALTYEYDFYNTGGQVDSVNALLTPGEAVINPRAARAIGYDVLEAMNNFKMPRAELQALSAPLPPPRPARFADGGVVGAGADGNIGWPGGSKWNGGAPLQMINHFHIDAGDLLSEDQVRRKVIPVLNDVLRRSSQRVTSK